MPQPRRGAVPLTTGPDCSSSEPRRTRVHLTISITDGIRYLISDVAAATTLAGHREEDWRGTPSVAMPT
jgi:hypothetical protein